MVSDRMMQAIGTLERAVSRLENAALPLADGLTAPAAAGAAREALQSLDLLIAELKGKTDG